MTLFIVKIAPKQRSIYEKFLGIVGELSLIRENTCQSSSLSSDTKHRAVYPQTPTSPHRQLSAYTFVPQAKRSKRMTSTRSQVTELTEPIDDPEQLLRRHSTMADLRPQDTPNPEEAHAEQSEEATGDPSNAATNTATDAEATRVPENPREPVTPETGNRGDLYLPDMKNTRMKEACKKGIALRAGLFVVSCEGLKEFYDHTTLAIDTNSGNIEMYIDGDFSTFPLNASENPFPEDILREILKSDAEKKQEAGIPGRDLEKKFNRPLTREELDTRLGTFSQLVEMATVNFVMMEDTERQPYAIRIKDMLKLERRRGAIDKQLDELTIVFLADNDKRHEQGFEKV